MAFWKSESLLFANNIHKDRVIDSLSTLVLPQRFLGFIYDIFLLAYCKIAEPRWQRETVKTYQQPKSWKVFAVTSCYEGGCQHLIATAGFFTEMRFFSASFQLPCSFYKVYWTNRRWKLDFYSLADICSQTWITQTDGNSITVAFLCVILFFCCTTS